MINNKNIPQDTLEESTPTPVTDLEQLHAQMQDMQLEIDLLKETINVLKKDPSIGQTALKNREKAVIVDALRDRHSLPILLERLFFSKICYSSRESLSFTNLGLL